MKAQKKALEIAAALRDLREARVNWVVMSGKDRIFNPFRRRMQNISGPCICDSWQAKKKIYWKSNSTVLQAKHDLDE